MVVLLHTAFVWPEVNHSD